METSRDCQFLWTKTRFFLLLTQHREQLILCTTIRNFPSITLKTKSSHIHQTVVQMKPLLSISLAISPVLSASSAVAGFCRCWCLDEPSLLFDHFLASTPPPLAHTYTHTQKDKYKHTNSARETYLNQTSMVHQAL